MADNNPNALDAQAAAPPPAPTTPEPTPAPATPAPAASGGLWASMTGKQKLLVMAGGSVVAAVGAMYGAKQFNPMPSRAVAQTPAVTSSEPEKKPEPERTPVKTDDPGELPPVPSPVVKPAGGEEGTGPDLNKFKLPALDLPGPPAAPRELPAEVKTDKTKRPGAETPELALPPVSVKAPPVKPELALPDPDLPPVPSGAKPAAVPDLPDVPAAKKDTADPVPTVRIPGLTGTPPAPGPKPAAGEDTFKSVGGPPPIPSPPKTGPIIPAGGADTPTPPEKKAGDLKIDLDAPPAKKSGPADIPSIDIGALPPPPVPVPMGSAPTIPPVPGLGEKDPAPLPATPMLPEVKTPEVKLPEGPPGIALPKIDVGPAPMTPPTIDVRPAPAGPMTPPIERGGPAPLPPVGVGAPPEPAKKDSYEEDWHTPDNVSTYVGISNFYYKTPDYAKALEAYNRDRQKPGERIVRVPPTWVLDEKFPSLTGKDPKAGAATPSGMTFDKVEPAGATRPAPAPAVAAGSADEYKVTAEAGEKIKDIARKVYGDANAWRKLTDLNPNLDPTEPIPAGTTLRVGK
jgi:hypothetical protein